METDIVGLCCEHCGGCDVAIRLKGEDYAGWCQDCDKETELLEV